MPQFTIASEKLALLFLVLTFPFLKACADNPEISGQVIDFFGDPVEGVKVTIPGTTYNTSTGGDGRYAITYVPGEVHVSFTKEGYTGANMEFTLSTEAAVPAETVVLYKIPKRKGIHLLSEKMYHTLRQSELSREQKKFPSTLKWSAPAYEVTYSTPPHALWSVEASEKLVFVDNSDTPIALLRVNEDSELLKHTKYRNGETKIAADVIDENVRPVGNGLTVREAQLPAGSYAFVTQGSGTGPLDRPITDPIFAFRVKGTPQQEATRELLENYNGKTLDWIQQMLEKGADINARDKNGDTILHNVAQDGNTMFLQYLHTHGADSSTKNRDGLTVTDLLLRRNIELVMAVTSSVVLPTVSEQYLAHERYPVDLAEVGGLPIVDGNISIALLTLENDSKAAIAEIDGNGRIVIRFPPLREGKRLGSMEYVPYELSRKDIVWECNAAVNDLHTNPCGDVCVQVTVTGPNNSYANMNAPCYRMRRALKAGLVYRGKESVGKKSWPFLITLSDMDGATGAANGFIEWTTLSSIARFSGLFITEGAKSIFRFRTTSFVKEAPNVALGCTYALDSIRSQKLTGSFLCKGNVKGHIHIDAVATDGPTTKALNRLVGEARQ